MKGLEIGRITHRFRNGVMEAVRPEPMFVDDETLTEHLLFIGGTGSGKTTFFLDLLAQQCRRGGGAVFFDAKPTINTLKKIVAICYLSGRLDDLHILAPGADYSETYSMVVDGTIEEIADRIQGLYYSRESDYYRVTQHFAVLSLVEGIIKATGKRWHIGDLVTLLTIPEALMTLLDEATKRPEWISEAARHAGIDREKAYQTLHFLVASVMSSGYGGGNVLFQQVSGVGRALGRYIAGGNGRITLIHEPDINLRRIVLENKILYFAMPILQGRESAIQWATAVLVHLLNTIGYVLRIGHRCDPTFLLLLDEAGQYQGGALTGITEQAREAGVAALIAGQSLEQFVTNPKHGNKLDIIMDNTTIKIVGKIRNPKQVNMAADMFGKFKERRVTSAQSQSSLMSRPSITVSEHETHTVTPYIIAKYPRRGRAIVEIRWNTKEPEIVGLEWPLPEIPRKAIEVAEEYLSIRWPHRYRQPPPEECLGYYERFKEIAEKKYLEAFHVSMALNELQMERQKQQIIQMGGRL